MSVPLQPLGKSDIKKLESALLVIALFDPEVVEKMRDPKDRVTWVDSLAVAAAAFARRKAGMSITEISDEVGRSEGTIRNHLEEKTEAGKIIKRAFQKLVENRGNIEIEISSSDIKRSEIEEAKVALDSMEKLLSELSENLNKLRKIFYKK